jgi:hypothetical protein
LNEQCLRTGICIILLLCASAPAGAVVLVTPYQGTVTALDPGAGTLTLNADATYGCSYEGTARTCTWSPITPISVTGTMEGDDAGSLVASGDRAEASIAGGDGGRWVAIGRLELVDGEEVLSVMTGDLSALSTPLAGGYAVGYRVTPDCTSCSGTLCAASRATVIISRAGKDLLEETLLPGGIAEYADPEDGSSISVAFLGGSASSLGCGTGTGMAGPQPFSSFTVRVQAGTRPQADGSPGSTPVVPVNPGTSPATIPPAGTVSPPTAIPTGLLIVPAGIFAAAYLAVKRKRP